MNDKLDRYIKFMTLFIGFLLIAGIYSWQYFYYQVLRVIVTIASLMIAYIAVKNIKYFLATMFGIICILFNPIMPI